MNPVRLAIHLARMLFEAVREHVASTTRAERAAQRAEDAADRATEAAERLVASTRAPGALL